MANYDTKGMSWNEIVQAATASGLSTAEYISSHKKVYGTYTVDGQGYWYTDATPPGHDAGAAPITNANGDIVGWTGNVYGGGGGYGPQVDPTDADRDAAKILAAVANENADIAKDAYDHLITVYDLADAQSVSLKNLQDCQARRKASVEWMDRQQNLQSVAHQLLDKAAGALNSSLWYDFREAIARADDMGDTKILQTLRENLQQNELKLAEVLMDTNNKRNELAANTEESLRQIMTDFIAQLNNIHPGLVKNASDSPTGAVIVDVGASVPADIAEPTWLDFTSFFVDHDFPAITPQDVALLRPSNAAQVAWELGLLKEIHEKEGAADPARWQAMQAGSERTTQ